MLNHYDIWMHFFGATGEAPWKQRIATNAPGENFSDACRRWALAQEGKNQYDTPYGVFDPERLSVWACPLSPSKDLD